MAHDDRSPQADEAEGSVHLTIRTNRAWRAWAKGLARADRSELGQLIDRLLAEHAKRIGHEPPPPRGMGR